MRPPRILLRSSWHSINIGDIGHTPGALALLEEHFPEALVTLWPNKVDNGVREMLTAAFPRLKIVEGSIDSTGKPASQPLAQAWQEADLYLGGSGSGFPASNHAAAFHRLTGKPFGVFGVSTDPLSGLGPGRDPEGGTLEEIRAKAAALPPTHLDGEVRYAVEHAAFMFCRDTISRDYLRSQGVRTPILEFGPDAQLAMRLRDDEKGDAFRKSSGLETDRFICVIPRQRYTPYHRIYNKSRTAPDEIRDAINARTTDADHFKLREMIVLYVRRTGNKVLACPEMVYEMELARTHFVDPLPADVKPNVIWRESFWLPDEAASVYANAQAVVSLECHSPLIAYHNGTPAIYVRQPTDTCKGQMYRDFGANEWLLEVDQTSAAELCSRLEGIHRDVAQSRAKVRAIMNGVENHQRRMVDVLRETVESRLNSAS